MRGPFSGEHMEETPLLKAPEGEQISKSLWIWTSHQTESSFPPEVSTKKTTAELGGDGTRL